MIRIQQLKLPVGHSNADLEQKIRKTLHLDTETDYSYQIWKRSLDARKKPLLYYVYSIDVRLQNETAVQKSMHKASIITVQDLPYRLPACGDNPMTGSPVIVGAGPAGLFCAYLLSQRDFHPILLERGKRVEEREKDVALFWETGVLNQQSNVQFGEGGAGTFSDGKLNTAVHDPLGRDRFVLETFVKFGAPEEILYDSKPHIGTDILKNVIRNLRNTLIEKGCRLQFDCCVTDLSLDNGRICGVFSNGKRIPSSVVVFAPGHSARDTFRMLLSRNLQMEAKNFAVGFRVEHPQGMIDHVMYGDACRTELPASPYKLTANFPDGRGVYSFCMCPGGYVVNASSEPGRTAVNGMSDSARDGQNANSAIIVSTDTRDFGARDPLAGLRFQERLEEQAFHLGGGRIPQQLYGDYLQDISSSSYGGFSSATKGACVFSNLRGILTPQMESVFCSAMESFSRKIKGFNREDAILSAMESRTSSPVRILRNEGFESSIRGLYPCGEGAGYAGGIMSAAMDGMKTAEAIIRKYKNV